MVINRAKFDTCISSTSRGVKTDRQTDTQTELHFLYWILTMAGSAPHQLAQWLTSVIDPVSLLHSTHCISNFFTLFTRLELLTFLHLSFSAPMTSVAFLLMFHSQKPLKSALMLCIMSLLRLLFLMQFLWS